MTQLFSKAACFTDIHFGNKGNSRQFNMDCEDFVSWFISEAKARECDTCIFLGDWHHNRASLNVSTLNYTVSNIGFLSEAFEHVYLIMGNHDLYYREKREINSVPFANLWSNVTIVNDSTLKKDDVAIVPWLVGDEWKKLQKLKVRYVFGHFELPHFKMNAMIEMPDQGGLKANHLSGPEYVFSGHFHKRQNQGNVWYIGNAFPHNYADAGDDERGAMFLEWGGKPEFAPWPDAPKYKTLLLSQILDDPDKHLSPKTYCRVTLDINITYEEANFIKETFITKYKLRDIALIPYQQEEHAQDWQQQTGDIEFESVNQIVLKQIQNIDSEIIDNNLLIDIYNRLDTDKEC